MGRRRGVSASCDAIRARAYRARRDRGYTGLRVDVDLEAARRFLRKYHEDDALDLDRAEIERLIGELLDDLFL
jgi:hypothetical protein